MRSISEAAPVTENPIVSRNLQDWGALALLAAFALAWPAFASPQFWANPFSQHDILGVDSIAYFTAIMNDISAMAYERRPLFGMVMPPLKWAYVVLFGLEPDEAAAASFHTVGVLPPLLTYGLARFKLNPWPSFVLALFSAASLVVMFNAIAYDSYGLTIVVGVAALIAVTAYYRWLPDPVTRRPILGGLIAIAVTLAAGWIALTLLSVLLLFLIPPFVQVRRPWHASLWGGLVVGVTGILFLIPSFLKPWVSGVQGAMATRYFLPEHLISPEAWANVLTADFIAALAYPGATLSGSRYPGVTNVEDWMGPVRQQAIANPGALILAALFLGLMAMSWRAVSRSEPEASLVVSIWLALTASVGFFAVWSPGEAMLFSGCVWPYQIALAIIGRAQIGPRWGRFVDGALVVLALAMFASNLSVLNETARALN